MAEEDVIAQGVSQFCRVSRSYSVVTVVTHRVLEFKKLLGDKALSRSDPEKKPMPVVSLCDSHRDGWRPKNTIYMLWGNP